MSNGKLVNDGVQSHCGSLAFITRKSSCYDVTTQFLLVTRTICSGLSAGIFARETSHILVSLLTTLLPVVATNYCSVCLSAIRGGARVHIFTMGGGVSH